MDNSHTIKKGRKRSDKWQDRFLEHFERYGNTTYAARLSNVSTSTVYKHQRENPEFNAQCDEAYAMFNGRHEAILVGHSEAGNLMATFAVLRANMPEKYRENAYKIEQTITHDYVVEIGTPRVPAITNNADTIQDVTPQRVYETTGDVLE
jgi:hypothetical protein